MRYALGLFLIGFSFFGLGFFCCGIDGLWSIWRRRAFLRSAVGEVIKVEMHHLNLDPESGDDSVYTPVLRFKTASGEVKTFRSAISVGSSSTYKVGMTLPVLYDLDNVIPPMIDSWMTIWGGQIVFLFVGLFGLGVAALVGYAWFVLHFFRC